MKSQETDIFCHVSEGDTFGSVFGVGGEGRAVVILLEAESSTCLTASIGCRPRFLPLVRLCVLKLKKPAGSYSQ